MTEFSLTQEADFDTNTPEAKKKLERLHFENFTRLGGSSIDVHLEDDDFITAFSRSVRTYRSMSSRSVFQNYGLLAIEPTSQLYILNQRVDNVVRIWRGRGLFGGNAGGSGAFESFGAATANTLLRGGIGQNGAAFDLFSYDLVLQYQETLDRLFVREYHFVFRNDANSIFFTQVPNQNEIVVLDCRVLKSIDELLNDHFAYRWLQDYALAEERIMLGEKYRLFSTLPGAQGGTVKKGESLVTQGVDDKQRLEDDLLLYADSGEIPQPIRG